jgi:metallophosphoesterase (TIGR00282 family)
VHPALPRSADDECDQRCREWRGIPTGGIRRGGENDVIVLMVGDVVGAAATVELARRLPALRREHAVDLVVVNAENSAPSGLGPTEQSVELLLSAGADVITGGNHSWDSLAAVRALGHPRVLRPVNLAEDVAGRGTLTLEAAGEPVTVVNLADSCAMRSARGVAHKFLPAFPCWLRVERTGTVLVDYHGEHVLEKQIFAHAVDGVAAAVVGTHTHEPTEPLRILPGGTALVTDVGMTGPSGGAQGFDAAHFVRALTVHGNAFHPPLPRPVQGPIVLGAVLLDIAGGRTRRVERVR